jgi:tetratricopeptide (TPR) repeat protein
LRYDPGNPDVHHALGMLYLDRRRWAEAFDQFTAAVRGDPNSLEAAYNRAVALYRLGRLAEARAAVGALLPRIPPGPKFESYRRAAEAILRAGADGGPAQNPLGAHPERSEDPR